MGFRGNTTDIVKGPCDARAIQSIQFAQPISPLASLISQSAWVCFYLDVHYIEASFHAFARVRRIFCIRFVISSFGQALGLICDIWTRKKWWRIVFTVMFSEFCLPTLCQDVWSYTREARELPSVFEFWFVTCTCMLCSCTSGSHLMDRHIENTMPPTFLYVPISESSCEPRETRMGRFSRRPQSQ
jgi:hypothetical protein